MPIFTLQFIYTLITTNLQTILFTYQSYPNVDFTQHSYSLQTLDSNSTLSIPLTAKMIPLTTLAYKPNSRAL